MRVGRSHWPRGLRRVSTAVRLLGLWVRILPGAWISVSFEYCVLSGRGLCGGLITRPEESYRLWCVVVCDLETSRMRRSLPALGRSATGRQKKWEMVLDGNFEANTVCPTRYRTRHFFNNSNTNEDISTKFQHECVRFVRNEEECVCSPLQISLQYPH